MNRVFTSTVKLLNPIGLLDLTRNSLNDYCQSTAFKIREIPDRQKWVLAMT